MADALDSKSGSLWEYGFKSQIYFHLKISIIIS